MWSQYLRIKIINKYLGSWRGSLCNSPTKGSGGRLQPPPSFGGAGAHPPKARAPARAGGALPDGQQQSSTMNVSFPVAIPRHAAEF